MPKTSTDAAGGQHGGDDPPGAYREADFAVDAQVGFLLRRAYQRATANLAAAIGEDVTGPQFAVLARLYERGPLSQNRLGRLVDMEPATIHGVIRRLSERALLTAAADPEDGRRSVISLTAKGREKMAGLAVLSQQADARTVAPLTAQERETLLALLRRVAEGEG